MLLFTYGLTNMNMVMVEKIPYPSLFLCSKESNTGHWVNVPSDFNAIIGNLKTHFSFHLKVSQLATEKLHFWGIPDSYEC